MRGVSVATHHDAPLTSGIPVCRGSSGNHVVIDVHCGGRGRLPQDRIVRGLRGLPGGLSFLPLLRIWWGF